MEFKNSNVLLLCITAFLAMAGGALLAPALPEMVEPLQTNTQTVGLLMSVYALSTAIFTLVIGHFIDRVNRKKILGPCLLIYGFTGVVCFFVSDFQLLLVLRFIQGSGVAAMMTLPLLIIGDVYKGLNSVLPISKVSISLAIGAVFAPIIGGGLAIIGWNYPFLFYALSLPFAIVVMAFLPETRVQIHADNYKGIFEAFTSLKDLRILYTIFMGFAIYFLLFSMVIYVPFMLKNTLDFESGQSGMMLAIEGIAVILLASRVRVLTSKYSVILVIVAGFALVGLSMIVMSFVHSIVAIILLLLLFGAGYGLAQTAIDVQIIQVSPSNSRGGILSIHSCMKYVGMSFSPIILGVVLLYFGLNMVFEVTGILGLLIALMTYLMKKRFDKPGGYPFKHTKISAI